MITNITLENFKCFRKVSIDPKLVTLFIGPNGTGKSGILQALLLLKQSRDPSEQLDLSGRLVNLPPEEFLFRGIDVEPSKVGLSILGLWNVSSDIVTSPVRFSLPFVFTSLGVAVEGNRMQIGLRCLGNEMLISVPRDGRMSTVETPEGSITFVSKYGLGAIEVSRRTASVSQGLMNALMETFRVPATVLSRSKAVPAARGFARQTYTLGRDSAEDITTTEGLGQQEEQAATTLAYSDLMVSKVSGWMEQVTGVGFKMPLIPPQSIKPVSITSTGEVSLTAEGFGTNALVQLLFELARAEEGAAILMEEPEIHLHPRAQAELTSVIVEEAKASNKQVIMTTHREHIANRLLTLVAEGKISPEEVAIYSFEKDEETGVCSASEIEVTHRGQVKGGLKSFFEAHMEEMRRYVDALRAQE